MTAKLHQSIQKRQRINARKRLNRSIKTVILISLSLSPLAVMIGLLTAFIVLGK